MHQQNMVQNIKFGFSSFRKLDLQTTKHQPSYLTQSKLFKHKEFNETYFSSSSSLITGMGDFDIVE